MTIPPYPLQWPDGVQRTPVSKRLDSPFLTGFEASVANVAKSLRLFQKEAGVKIEHVVLSTNVDLLTTAPTDPGAAAWFLMDTQWMAFGIDRFSMVEANVQAIHHIIEARRAELRYGGLAIVRQTFRAFLALPNPERPWWEVLGIPQDSTGFMVDRAYKNLAAQHQPDKGGDNAMIASLTAARAAALKEISV